MFDRKSPGGGSGITGYPVLFLASLLVKHLTPASNTWELHLINDSKANSGCWSDHISKFMHENLENY